MKKAGLWNTKYTTILFLLSLSVQNIFIEKKKDWKYIYQNEQWLCLGIKIISNCSLVTLHFLFLLLFLNFNQSSILYTSVYTCHSQSPNSSHHQPHPLAAFPPWCPYVCSLHLCLNFCSANRFICTIFLGSTYMR